MATPNPLLPLSVKTATPFTSFQESRTKTAQNQLLESRVRGAERQEMSEQEQARTIERFRNVESGVKQLSPLLDQAIATGNIDELMAGLQSRRQGLLDQGITDTSDTDTAIQAVQSGNLQGARQLFDQVLSQGQRLDEAQLGLSPQRLAADAPSSVREFEFFQGLNEKDQKTFSDLKRQNAQFATVAGVPSVVDKSSGTVTPLSDIETEADAAAAIAGAETEARETAQIASLPAKTRAEALKALPEVEATATEAIALIDDILDEPNLNSVIGFIQGRFRGVSGAQRGTVRKVEQLQGKVFLDAFERLKGGGQITELEGKAATDAQARISDRTVDEESFREAVLELREIIERGLTRAREQAGQDDVSALSDEELLRLLGDGN
jgi:hypothetical protein